jgi:alpha-beta hydrolase superfamily lysophospholipase
MSGNENTQKPIVIFAHGMFDTKKQAEQYKIIAGDRIVAFDFEDALTRPPFIRPQYTCFAQEGEIEQLYAAYTKTVQFYLSRELPVPPIILIGLSRGASTVFTTLATKQMPYVKAAILESPFDSIEAVLHDRFSSVSLFSSIFSRLFYKAFPRYNREGITPCMLANRFPHTIPVLFIASKKDKTVPYQRTVVLYEALKNTGHQKTVCFVFPNGAHAKIIKVHQKKYSLVVLGFLQTVVEQFKNNTQKKV